MTVLRDDSWTSFDSFHLTLEISRRHRRCQQPVESVSNEDRETFASHVLLVEREVEIIILLRYSYIRNTTLTLHSFPLASRIATLAQAPR
jgi:hypothetical protein